MTITNLASSPERFVLGQMSGTSLDGVDLALTRLQGSGEQLKIELLQFVTYPIRKELRNRIKRCFESKTEDICRLNYDLGMFYAELISDFRKSFHHSQEIDLIGLHGQTIYHVHNHSTMQIGEADVVACQTGIPVVADFRAADIAMGGCGAPLVSYLDFIILGNQGKNIAVQNLGGIGNVTFLPAHPANSMIAFDTGPANLVINELAEILSHGKESFDQDGKFSQQGTLRKHILDELLSHPFFALSPPKSTGREEFGQDYTRKLIEQYPQVSLFDLLRTAVSLTTHSVYHAYRNYLPSLDEIYVSGGGTHHPILWKELEELFDPVPVQPLSDVLPINEDAKEAVAFAVLAHERINHVPTNITAVTGAQKSVLLGKISDPLSLL